MNDMTRCGARFLAGVSALALAAALGGPALAQNAEPENDGEFIGTITLGESKREVQTDTATPVTRIDQEEIDDRQASTIAELIDSVPGVTLVNGSTPSGSGINIRGFGANSIFGTDQKVAILIDGATSGSEELYRIGTQLFTDPYLYRSVEVQRGTVGSFEYGSGIVGGVVRLETIDASDLTGGEPGFKLAQTLGAYTNQDGFTSSSTLAWQPTENLEFLANYSYREQSNQEDGNGDEIGNSAFDLPSFLLKARYEFGESGAHALEASYTETEVAERDVPYDTFITSTDIFGNVDRDIVSQTAALTYTFNPFANDLIDFEAALTYANQEIDSTFIEGSTPLADFVRDLANADQQFETTKLTIKNASFVETGPVVHNFRYGFELIERERLDANAAPGGTDERYAFFLIDEVELTQGLIVTPALRYEHSSIEGLIPDPAAPPAPPFGPAPPVAEVPVSFDNDALMGGVSARYQFDSGLALFGSYAYTESLPILDDLENPVFIERSEKATTWEAGASYDRIGVFAEQDTLALKLTYYDTKLDDVTSYSGVDEVKIDGLEIEGSYTVASGFYIDLNATFTTGDEIAPDGAVTDWRNIPQDSIRTTLGQRFGPMLDLSAEWVRVFEAEDRATTFSDGDGFDVVNLRATFAPQEGVFEGTELRVGVENVFDEAYTPLLSTRPAPGRNFKVTISRVFF